MRYPLARLLAAALCLRAFLYGADGAPVAPRNQALAAHAAASESYGDLTPEKAHDGDAASRWSGIPGHNQGVWYQLTWDAPVRIAEVVIHQYDRFVMELDVQALETAGGQWRTLAHRGKAGERLPRVVVVPVTPVETTALRIGNITNGPSFTELEVYDRPFGSGAVTTLASDLQGNFYGVVSDKWGGAPVASARVTLAGTAAGGPWEESATSDEHGVVTIPMPLGLTGKITARTSLPSVDAPSTTDELSALDFQYGLTPRTARQDARELDDEWRFAPDPPDDFWRPDFDAAAFAPVHVPAHWEMEGFKARSGIGGYRLVFPHPPGEGRFKLGFDGVYSGAEVWLNGIAVARHEGGATPFDVDITAALRDGENLLAVRVREHTPTSDDLDHMSLYADFPLAGIFRSVTLFRVPETHVGSLHVTTDLTPDGSSGKLEATLAILNECAAPFEGRISLRIGDVFSEAPVALKAWSRTSARAALTLDAPHSWNAERPRSYDLEVALGDRDGTVLQWVKERIGFRTVAVKGPELLVNGRPVKLRGTCHHDTHPLMGRAVTEELTHTDLALIKEANLNAVRTSHYPPIPALPILADEFGLYVEDEASFCWVGVADDLRRAPRIVQLTAELVERDFNRPSVIIWSLCNESQFGASFRYSERFVRALDPRRPLSAATSATLDLATLHNPLSIARIDANEKLDRPLLFDESLCIFQGIFNDVAEMWVDPGIRDYYAVPLRGVYARFMTSTRTQGSMIWCWADDIFCVPGRGIEFGRNATRCDFLSPCYKRPGRGIVGDAPWGVVDGWRREKPEFWITKKLHSPIKIAEDALPVPAAGEPLVIPVENQYDFTDLSELDITWRLGAERGTLAAHVPPRTRGELRVAPAHVPRGGDTLALEFRDRAGRLVDTFRLPIGTDTPPLPSFTPLQPGTGELRIEKEETLAGAATRVIGEGFELAFDDATGLLRRGVAGKEALLLEYPTLHVLPTARPQGALPDPLTWHLERMDVARDGERVRVTIRGAYRDFAGEYTFLIAPAGEITARASFTYSGDPMHAREIGLRVSVPRNCDTLAWRRKAEWRVYPEDHIGRPAGTARAFPEPTAGDVAARPWGADPSPMGSNDFRSTKRAIHWAGLRVPDGPGILVDGGGVKHARACADTDRIDLRINDWYGGTNVGWQEWILNYGEGKLLEKGAVIESTLQLRLGTLE